MRLTNRSTRTTDDFQKKTIRYKNEEFQLTIRYTNEVNDILSELLKIRLNVSVCHADKVLMKNFSEIA
jgi:hypothetical protein